jgi:glycosyltransferase involved in cell wall biosynthesis
MLSIVIPTYNYSVFELVLELKNQCDSIAIDYEIIVQDDHSNSENENEKINKLVHCTYSSNSENLGRAKNRNLLAQKAKYPYLLFLDADTFPIHNNFISNYVCEIIGPSKIIYGGIQYQEEEPTKEKLLRWVYGKKREALSVEQRNKNIYLSFLTLNFLIHKEVFKTVSFNESIPNLRHEDTLFSYELMKNNISLKHVENPVYHFGIDKFDKALQKEHESLLALKNLLDNNLLAADYVKISRLYTIIKNLKAKFLVAFSFKIVKPLLLKNISSANPSLLLFDIYRIGYICSIKK